MYAPKFPSRLQNIRSKILYWHYEYIVQIIHPSLLSKHRITTSRAELWNDRKSHHFIEATARFFLATSRSIESKAKLDICANRK